MEHAIIQEIRSLLKTGIEWPIGKTESPLKLNTAKVSNPNLLPSIDKGHREKANANIANYRVPVRTVVEKSIDDVFKPTLEVVITNLEETIAKFRNNNSTLKEVELQSQKTHRFINLYLLLLKLENAMISEFYVTSEIPKTLIISGEIEDKEEIVKVVISTSIIDFP